MIKKENEHLKARIRVLEAKNDELKDEIDDSMDILENRNNELVNLEIKLELLNKDYNKMEVELDELKLKLNRDSEDVCEDCDEPSEEVECDKNEKEESIEKRVDYLERKIARMNIASEVAFKHIDRIFNKIEVGDLFQLGKHRLFCGDARLLHHFEKLFGNEKARLIFTDPPYMVNYSGPEGKSDKIMNDNFSDDLALLFYQSVLFNLREYSKDDVTIYWWFANNKNHINRQAWLNTGWHMSQIVMWIKNGMVFALGQLYHRKYEPCMVGWKKGKTPFRNKHINNLDDVINLDFDDYVEMLDIWFENKGNVADYVHPTQKPVRLSERALKKSSQAGDIVADVFGGSGSTLIACEQLNRKCYMMELDPNYCKVIIDRYEKFTGDKAVKI